MSDQAEYARRRRENLVKLGKCGWCKQPRNLYQWLCDDCAFQHRKMQRDRKQAKQANEAKP